jgi:exopolyphosphatase/pppGpp-phosphohydrolase
MLVNNKAELNSRLGDWFLKYSPDYLEVVTSAEFQALLTEIIDMGDLILALKRVEEVSGAVANEELLEALTKPKKKVRIRTRTLKARRNDLYYRYLNLSDLWNQYSSLVSQSGDNCLSKSKQEKALAKSAAYMYSAIEEQEKALEREEKRLEEEGDE